MSKFPLNRDGTLRTRSSTAKSYAVLALIVAVVALFSWWALGHPNKDDPCNDPTNVTIANC